jgi:outer membrane biosynthesis protein TonB
LHAGASHAPAAPPRPKRRVALAIGLVVGAAIGAGAVVFALRDPAKPVRHHAPAGAAVAPPVVPSPPPPPDAAVMIEPPAPPPPSEPAPPPPPIKPPVHAPPPHKPAPTVVKHPVPAPPDDDGNAELVDPAAQIASARAALESKEPDKALALAQGVLKHLPHNRAAIGIGVIAACRLKRDKVAHEIFAKLPQLARGEARKLREQCEELGVIL